MIAALLLSVCQLVAQLRHKASLHVHFVTDLFLAWPTLAVRCGSAIIYAAHDFCYNVEVVQRFELASTVSRHRHYRWSPSPVNLRLFNSSPTTEAMRLSKMNFELKISDTFSPTRVKSGLPCDLVKIRP